MSGLLDLVSKSVETAQKDDRLAAESLRREREANILLLRQKAEENQRNQDWQRLVGYFANIHPAEGEWRFTKKAREIFTSPRFDAATQDIFRAAVQKYPDKFIYSGLREYLRQHNDTLLAEFYVQRFLGCPSSEQNIPKGHPVLRALKATLSVVAAAVDTEKGFEKEKAREVMRQFCSLALDRFPYLPDGLYHLLMAVEKTGDLREQVSKSDEGDADWLEWEGTSKIRPLKGRPKGLNLALTQSPLFHEWHTSLLEIQKTMSDSPKQTKSTAA